MPTDILEGSSTVGGELSTADLYRLYVRYNGDWRAALLMQLEASADLGDDDKAKWRERYKRRTRVIPADEFEAYLRKTATRGGTNTFVNKIVLGYDYAVQHPNDPRIRVDPARKARHVRASLEAVADQIARTRESPTRPRD